MRDLEQLLYLRQFFGTGQGWLQAGFLLCLFAVLLFRRERIRSPGLFTWAWLLFALSFIVPHALTFCLGFLQFIADDYSARSGRGGAGLLMLFQFASGPLLFGLSMILAFLSLTLRPPPPHRATPAKHPLE